MVVTGDVTVTIWIDAGTGRASLRGVSGNVDAEQQACLDDLVRSASIPTDLPTGGELSLRLQ